MTIENLIKTLNDVKSNTSTKKKEKILVQAFEDESVAPLLHQVLTLALSPSFQYGMTTSEDEVMNVPPAKDPMSFIELMDYIEEEAPFRSNDKKAHVLSLIRSLECFYQTSIAIGVINKDINIGIGATTINKAIKSARTNLLPLRILKPMKAFSERDIDIDKFFEKNALSVIQPKIDAARAFMVIVPKKNIGYFLSANGRRIDCFTHLTDPVIKQFQNRYSSEGFESSIIDGELIAGDYTSGELVYYNRQKSNGMLNKAIRGTIDEQDARKFHFIAWDLIDGIGTEDDPELPLYDDTRMLQDPYYDRFEHLEDFITAANEETETSMLSLDLQVHLIESQLVYNEQQAREYVEKIFQQGGEGAVLKEANHRYTPKRSRDLIKMKKQFMADVRVTGVNEGKKQRNPWVCFICNR